MEKPGNKNLEIRPSQEDRSTVQPLPSNDNVQQGAQLFEVPSAHKLRGDYSAMQPDYTVEQPYDQYTAAEHERWRFLYARQNDLLPDYADQAFLEGLEVLGSAGAIPRLDVVNEVLSNATGWRLVAVPGLIPNDVFFQHLAERRFPVSWWMRGSNELDYLVEPDIFHDFYGHVPLLSNPIFADYMHKIGEQGLIAIECQADHLLARLYWYIIEFGLIKTDQGLRAFGAGMLSSKSETIYSVESPVPIRLGFDLERVMSTSYMVDDFQKTYFVIDNYQTLFDAISDDLAPMMTALKDKPAIDPAKINSGDYVISAGHHHPVSSHAS